MYYMNKKTTSQSIIHIINNYWILWKWIQHSMYCTWVVDLNKQNYVVNKYYVSFYVPPISTAKYFTIVN
jgi:hypothetical protein